MNAPTSEERYCYYAGLPSAPVLVARSSALTTPWNPSGSPKRLDTIGDHPIIQAWDKLQDGFTLSEEIQAVFSGLNWCSIDVLRIGHREEDRPVTILVTVLPGTTSHEVAFPLTLECRESLQEWGIYDVHCEVKEGRLIQQAGQQADEHSDVRKLLPLKGAERPEAAAALEVELSDSISTSIGPYDQAGGSGTKGLYLHLNSPEGKRTVLLTCRHVALSGGKDEQMGTYQHLKDTYMYRLVQPSTPVIEEKIAFFQDGIRTNAELMVTAQQSLVRPYRQPTGVEAPNLQVLNTHISAMQRALSRLRPLRPVETRVIGHLLYTPFYTTRRAIEGGRVCNGVRDWALIELHQERFARPLSDLTNDVYIPLDSDHASTRTEAAAIRLNLGLGKTSKTAALKLSGIVRDQQGSKEVMKASLRSGLTKGYLNEIKSLTRWTMGTQVFISEDLCIVGSGLNGEGFSRCGDSGSAIWDLGRSVCGMLTGGVIGRLNLHTDVSYAAPIDRLLQDVKDFGFDVELA